MTGDELAALLESDEVALLDVRSHEEYSGEAGYPCDPYQGHIPGAIHLDLNDIYAAGEGSPGCSSHSGSPRGAES